MTTGASPHRSSTEGRAVDQSWPATSGSVELSIIIVNWNVCALLEACLRSVYDEMCLEAQAFEIIVVDNASSDGSAAMVRRTFPGVRVVENVENRGFGGANNQALALCRGRYVLLLNPDTVVLDHAVDRMIAHLERRADVAALACRLRNSDGSFQRWTAGAFPTVGRAAAHAFFIDRWFLTGRRPHSLFLSDDVRDEIEVDWVSGACMLLRREALGDYIFDERFFMYGEDAELCDRLGRAGWRVLYSPCADVVHHAGRSMCQQTGDILLTSFKGPREFYRLRHGSRTLWLYDACMASAFLVRTVAYAGLAVLRPGRDHRTRVRSSWMYFRRALLVMLGR